MNWNIRILAFAFLFTIANSNRSLHAGLISGLYTTGVDDNGLSLPLGSVDPHYFVLNQPSQASGPNAMVMSSLPGSYLGNTWDSRWIWQTPNGTPVHVTKTFRTTFDLTGYDHSTAMITGSWATDNYGRNILINGVPTGFTSSTFSFPSHFSISSGFQPGVNQLDFIVQDVGGIAGFRVLSLEGTADIASATVPEPSSLALFFGVSVPLWLSRRRQRMQ